LPRKMGKLKRGQKNFYTTLKEYPY
jgi:hypothetical protein